MVKIVFKRRDFPTELNLSEREAHDLLICLAKILPATNTVYVDNAAVGNPYVTFVSVRRDL